MLSTHTKIVVPDWEKKKLKQTKKKDFFFTGYYFKIHNNFVLFNAWNKHFTHQNKLKKKKKKWQVCKSKSKTKRNRGSTFKQNETDSYVFTF